MEKVERVRRAEQEQVKQAKPLDWGEPTPPEPQMIRLALGTH
jgi:hypothetical protein